VLYNFIKLDSTNFSSHLAPTMLRNLMI